MRSSPKRVEILHFDVYLFDERGALLQLVPIQAASHDGARERALYLQRTQRAVTYMVRPIDIQSCKFSAPSQREIEAHQLLLQARDQLRRRSAFVLSGSNIGNRRRHNDHIK